MKKTNDELDSIFDEKSLHRTLKKAKYIAFLRTVFISALVVCFVITVLIKGNDYFINTQGNKLTERFIKENHVRMSPNTFTNTDTISTGILKGTIKSEVFKVIEDKVISWGTEQITYDLNGNFNASFSTHSTIVNDTTMYHIPNGQREMLFYVPKYKYKVYANDFDMIKDYPNDKYMEMAISFDKNYTLKEVQKMLPTSAHQTWYWVDNYNYNYKYAKSTGYRGEPESGRWLLGISKPSPQLGVKLTSNKVKTEADFLNELQKTDPGEVKSLKDRQKNGLIIGVVVTGTKEELLSLQNKPYVKAASLGAVVDKY
ncbi:anti sigma factor C-terminal domain-containing protein (plasmid) [Priestia aryabhattai]|uniref:anti sigma factor C-terminal domain-containing protein n=1 Tax=Priestia aryabhattai TaxID=412384 RepID=UPI0025A3265A|nr:anti sigma factor C-terminal domain-containing protein [Priestia aryabhattai]WJN47546.1 anti sigma factor C-terminal domain-containing protein [Priestia aryabhattai]